MRHFISLIENINTVKHTVPQDVIDAIGETLNNGTAWSLEQLYSYMDEFEVSDDATAEVFRRLLPNIQNWLELMINEYTLVGAIDSIVNMIDEEGIEEFKPILIQTIKQNRGKVIKGLLRNLQQSVMGMEYSIEYLMSLGFEWPELQTIYDSVHTGRY
jgi:hypothetical protein